MEILIKATQFILSLSILVTLHELGHFIPARIFKMRVEKFYLFFDPWFSLFKRKKGETEYGVGWLPLGGYVKIAGMIDESMDKEQMKQPAQPWEFRSKPTWQRLIVMVGGVTVNVILGVLIYAMIAFTWGEEYLPVENAKYGIYCDSLAKSMGLQNGDKILSIDHKKVDAFAKLPIEIALNQGKTIQVDRNGQQIDILIKEETISAMIDEQNLKSGFIDVLLPCEVDSLLPGLPAEKSGLKVGDKVVSINGEEAIAFQSVVEILQKNKEKEVAMVVNRGGEFDTIMVNVSAEGKIGFAPKPPDELFEMAKREYGFFESFPAGIRRGYDTFESYIRQMKMIFTVKDAHKSLGGFITIGKIFAPTWDWQRFWGFTAFFSIVLAIMNILPIPALDGGHVMFLTYEMITGRKPHEKVMEYAQYAGMILLLALMLYANGNDVVRLFNK